MQRRRSCASWVCGIRVYGRSVCMLREMATTVEEGLVDSSNREGVGEGTGARRRSHVDGVESSGQLSGRRVRVDRRMVSGGEVGPCRSGGETAAVDLVSSEDEGSGDDTGPGQDDEGASNTIQQSLPSTPTVRRATRVENPADLTPNFHSAAAMAGWDDEALLMAAGGPESPAGLLLKQGMGRGTPEGSSRGSCSSTCEGCPLCRERKRGTRTPGQAATPLSAGRRHRRVRRVSSNEEPLVPIPMAVFINEGDKRGAPARNAECSHHQPSQDKENRDTQPCAKGTSLKATGEATGEAAEGNTIKNVLKMDQLKEELTCVVCLDICFEPSTTSCGHSFCRGCLQSVYQKCGMRCPKCRQELRATSKNDCPVNTVLWNTIQLLFPQETAARLKDQKKSSENDEKTERGSEGTEQGESHLRSGLVRRTARPIPWRELVTVSRESERLRPNVGVISESLRSRGNLTSFRRAPDVLESYSTANHPNRFIRLRVRRPTTSWRNPETLRYEEDELRSVMSTSSWRDPETLRQEEEDAALAARLQQSFISEAGL